MRRRRFSAIAAALLDRLDDPAWAEREGAWTANATLHRLGWGWAPLVGARLERPERGERMLFSRLKQWEESGERAPPLGGAARRWRGRRRGSTG